MRDQINKLDYKRLLIISHNCLSFTGSNGRTLANYLNGWPTNKIAQLYIYKEEPDFNVCKNFFCITDNDVIKSFLKRKEAGAIVTNSKKDKSWRVCEKKQIKKRKKNSFIFLLRELFWNSNLWKKNSLLKWINDFSPEAILFQAGDAGFLFRLTLEIANGYNIPIILYNTEGYYFKTKSYFNENFYSKLFYPVLHRYFCKEYRKLMGKTKLAIYNCGMLMDDYKKVFPNKSVVIMNTSEFTDVDVKCDKLEHHIVYAGNVGIGRYESIIDVANAAHGLDNTIFVDLYASVNDPLILEKLNECEAIKIKGYVSYDKLKEILKNAEYLLSVENFNSFYCEDLKYAFSTKIADSLASGNCLIVYAPETIAVSQYLKDKNASVLITSKNALIPTLKEVFNNEEYRQLLCRNGRQLALKNHSIIKNRDTFQQLINEAIENESFTS